MTTNRLVRIGLFLLPGLVYAPAFAGRVAYPSLSSQFSDLLITHYPNLLFLKKSLLIHHQLPLWNTTIHSGTPLAANPLSGLFYLPGWLALFFKLPEGIALVIAGHAVFGTWGMYQLLKRLGLTEEGCLVGALSFGLMPKLAAHFGAGHVSLLYALAWTPWLFSIGQQDQRGVKTGITAGMLFLADPRWAVYAGLIWCLYKIAYRQISLAEVGIFFLRASTSAFLIASPLILPLLEYIPLTTRADLGVSDILVQGLPPGQILGLIIPAGEGNFEWYLYSGGFIVSLVVYQLLDSRTRQANIFWNITAGASLILAAGIIGPQAGWVRHLPGISLLRVPARSLFLTGFCFAVLAGKTTADLITKGWREQLARKTGFGLLVFSAGLGWGLTRFSDQLELIHFWGLVSLFFGGVFLMLLGEIKAKNNLVWLLITILGVDLLGASWQAYQVKIPTGRLEPVLLSELNDDPGIFRVYSPSYSVAQHEAVQYDLQLVDGVDPLQIAAYSTFMADASGVLAEDYSVTIPAFESGNPLEDNKFAKPNPDLLGLLNVKYIVADYELNHPDLQYLAEHKGQFLYQNSSWRSRVWLEVEGSGEKDDLKELSKQDFRLQTPNRIQLQTEGPGKLVFSEVYYPGWKVILDGKPIRISPAHSILRSINLPEGKHVITMVYRPISVYLGLIFASLGWLWFASGFRSKELE